MSGPIVRSGPSSQYSKNWENIFASKKAKSSKPRAKAGAKKSAPKRKKT